MDKENKKIIINVVDKYEKYPLEFSFIKDKPGLIYIIKKIEKLTGVAHILTANLLPDEPVRKELRRSCLLLLDRVLFRNKNIEEESFESLVSKCVSLVDISRLSLSISDMNASILKQEFLNLLKIMDRIREQENAEVSFDVSQLSVDGNDEEDGASRKKYKRHLSNRNVFLNKNLATTVFNKAKGKEGTISIGHQSIPRLQIIMDIIKNKGEVNFKDVRSSIRGVSGKTIQRDLLALVSDGVLKKTGERRWSRYSMATS